MSPNQRKKGKENITAWVPEGVAKKINERAKLTGRPRSEIAIEFIKAGMRKHGIRVEDEK